METSLEGLLKIRDNEGKLEAVVDLNPKTRAQTFYKTTECGVDDIQELLDKMKTYNEPK